MLSREATNRLLQISLKLLTAYPEIDGLMLLILKETRDKVMNAYIKHQYNDTATDSLYRICNTILVGRVLVELQIVGLEVIL
jgi:hypothetical protein